MTGVGASIAGRRGRATPAAQAVRAGALVVLAAVLVAALFVAGDVRARVGRPYPGFPVLAHGVVSVGVLAPPRFAVRDPHLRPPYRVVAIDGRPVRGGEEVRRVVDQAGVGALLHYRLQHPGGETVELAIPVDELTESDALGLYVPLMAGSLVLFVVGAVPVLLRPDLPTARLLFLFSTSIMTGLGLLVFDYVMAYRFTPWLRVTNSIAGAALLHLGLTFPERRGPFRRWPRATAAVVWLGSLALFAAHATAYYRVPGLLFAVDVAQMLQFAGGFLVFGGNCLLTALRSTDPRRRQQALVVLPGPVLYAFATVVLVASAWNLTSLRFTLFVPLPAVIMGVTLAYAMLAHNVFEFDAVVRRALTIGILTLAAATIYLALFAAVQAALGPGTTWAASTAAATLLLLVVPTAAPLWHRVERLVERGLFPEQRRARAVIHAASRELARVRDERALVRFLAAAVRRSVAGTAVRVVAGTPDGPLRELAPADASGALALAVGDPLHAVLRTGATLAAGAEGPAAAAAAVGAAVVVALPPRAELAGGLLLGPRRDGRLYTSDDVVLLETLAGQAATAIENARAWEQVRALEARLQAENVYLRREVEPEHGDAGIIGRSAAIRAVLAHVQQVAATDVAVLVEGETGTGKELVVRALHAQSRRAERVLVKVACAALPEALLESELFGHERGAFTGASSRKIGRFEVADGGTIFFDDVDTLPAGVQAKLLRALQEGEVQRLGSNAVRRVDVRVVAATNRDLLAEVAAGRFREDLYYRLNVVPIRLPPLRQRPEDIALLAEHFVRQESAKLGRHVDAIAPEALAALQGWDWPGNVRELRNVIERALVLCEDRVLRLPEPLGGGARPAARPADGADDLGRASLPELLRRYKTRLVARALQLAGGNQREAAALLGIHRPSLTRMLRELDLPAEPQRRPRARPAR